ncbi:MAG TPA: HAMP domain-containing sensor histidine kinase [Steroidobacteraceae bacterium]|nr:HAMP domain-containing sensor histidine kinase [Steroidobacteraceae bacterium]
MTENITPAKAPLDAPARWELGQVAASPTASWDPGYRRLLERSGLKLCQLEVPDGDGEHKGLRFVDADPELCALFGRDRLVGSWIGELEPDDAIILSTACSEVLTMGYASRDWHHNSRWQVVDGINMGSPMHRVVALALRPTEEIEDADDPETLSDRSTRRALATVAHELRNPLSALGVGLRVLSAQAAAEGSVPEVLTMMSRQLAHLNRLVNDLMDLGRTTVGKVLLIKEPVRIDEVVKHAIEVCDAALKARDHQLVLLVEDPSVEVLGDFDRLVQVVSNLIGNSAKYTPLQGRISVRVAREGAGVLIRVTDNGIGIPAEQMRRVFAPFSQLHSGGRLTDGGLGIGLTLVKYLVEQHGGTVEAGSEGAGRGSAFTVRLPVTDSAGPKMQGTDSGS